MASLESYRLSALAQKISVITMVLALSCSGCRLSYIFHAASHQYRIIHDSVKVEDALNNDHLQSDHRTHIRLVAQIKDFGETELGLKKTQNYQTVYLNSHQPPIYTLSASPKDRLARTLWWFPVVGNMPYLGFFDLGSAKKESEILIKQGQDVSIGVAEAYSTLGWFKDPLTISLLERSTVELAETILHEMTHTTLYIKGQGEFNEGLANLVGKTGALSFMTKTFGNAHPFTIEAENILSDTRLFSSYLASLLAKLERLYSSDLSYQEKLAERERIFEKSLEEFAGIQTRFRTDRFKGFGESGLNNAYLMSIGLYNRHFSLFESVLAEKGNSTGRMIDYLQNMSNKGEDMLELMKTPD
ncbi:aminopeptidase [Deltaproteobacteria bacterium]|nr:aminopeptidase [Deltaproteobacteria bacterium]